MPAAYAEHLRGLRRAPGTIRCFQARFGDLARFCTQQLGLPDPCGLQRRHLVAWFQDLRSRPLSPDSLYSRQRSVRPWLEWATLRGHLLLDPGRELHWRHPPHLPRGAPSEGQVKALLGHVTLQSTSHCANLVPQSVAEELLRTHPRGRRRRSPKPRK